MRIRTQFIVTVLLFGFVLAAIAASAIITGVLAERSSDQEGIAGSVAQGANELSYLANDYVMYGESQQLNRWQTRYAAFSQDVASLRPDNAEQRSLVAGIQANTQRMKDVFDSIAAPAGSSDGQGATPDLASLQVSWSRMGVQSQSLSSDANRLSQLLRSETDQLKQDNMIVIFVMVGVFGIYFAANYLLMQRRVLRSIAVLQAGTDVVGSGDLNFKVREESNDEVGDLSRSFNRMTSNLREMTASKTELERQIEERKKAEAALRESEEKYRNLFVNMAEEVHFWKLERDAGGRIKTWRLVDVNPPALKTWGRQSVDEIRGKTTDEIFGPGSTEHYMPVVQKIMTEGVPYSYEDYFPNLDKHFRFTSVPLGEYFITTGADITRIKQSEQSLQHYNVELEAANKELEAFSYSVSHDLRAPLRSMEGFSSALLEDYGDKLDDQGKKYLGYVQNASELMGQLIDDLLKLSRVTRAEMNYETVDLSDLARKVAADLEKANPEREVKVDIIPGLSVNGDRNLLRLALDNLIGNAWKFSGKVASPLIEIGVSEYNGKRAFFVRDNGVGFDMTYADKLFKPFQRLHKATDFPGTGIGLATVQRIIHRHAGEVWAEGKVGQGATFYFTLGLTESKHEQ